ncbi:MAG: ABC transporter permease subunit [Nanoarchaeota archaeon]|nr:ABC transporter permease subunit [Nanoarchaeota archaeon]
MNKSKHLIEVIYKAFFVLFFCFIFSPVLVLIIFSFNVDKYPTLPWKGFTLQWYKSLLSNSLIIEPLSNSIIVGISITLICLIIGFIGANHIIRLKKRKQDIALSFSFLPALFPTLLLGITFISYLSLLSIKQGILPIIIFQSVYLAPIAIGLIYYSLRKVDSSLEQTCYDLGGNIFTYIFKILIPLIKWNLVGIGLLIFTFSWDEFMISWFVSGFNQTISIKVWTMLKTAISPEINALGTIIVLFSVGLLITAFILINKKVKKDVIA